MTKHGRKGLLYKNPKSDRVLTGFSLTDREIVLSSMTFVCVCVCVCVRYFLCIICIVLDYILLFIVFEKFNKNILKKRKKSMTFHIAITCTISFVIDTQMQIVIFLFGQTVVMHRCKYNEACAYLCWKTAFRCFYLCWSATHSARSSPRPTSRATPNRTRSSPRDSCCRNLLRSSCYPSVPTPCWCHSARRRNCRRDISRMH